MRSDQDRAWKEIEQQMRQSESPNDFEAPGKVLIGFGTK
jgi:3,4-dihydroxy-2-butanone 4-phosphate synthase